MQKIDFKDVFLEDDINTGESLIYTDKERTKPFTGVVVDYFQGVLCHEFEVKNGYKNGIEKIYYPTGELMELNETDHNTINGIAKEFYKNGKLKSQSIVIRNVFINSITYDEHGNVLSKSEIKENDLEYNIVKNLLGVYRKQYKLE